MKVRIDREGCIACGMCVATCPNVFRMADDGFSEVYSQPKEEDYGLVAEAADNCPVQVISYEE